LLGRLGAALGDRSHPPQDAAEVLRSYAETYLQTFAQMPEFVRSLIGEAGQFSPELRQTLGQTLAQANRYTAQYFATMLPTLTRSPEAIADLLNKLLFGYAVVKFSSELEQPDREAFLTHLVELFLPESQAQSEIAFTRQIETPTPLPQVADLPAPLVHSILRQAKQSGSQDYALAYVLFAAGLSLEEVVGLRRSQMISDDRQHLLQFARRQVPLNQWVMGHRYGSRIRNPLTQWLKNRKDQQAAVFLSETAQPMSVMELRLQWQNWTAGLVTANEIPPAIEQAQQTWCIDMLTRGMSLENLSLLTGWSLAQLQPYAHRANEKLALTQAIQLDQKPNNRSGSGIPFDQAAVHTPVELPLPNPP
jgi:integrase